MEKYFQDICDLIKNNKKIIENYFFMTVLQILNSFFYLLIYPYLIRKLGVESYGLFIFINSFAAYFVYFINFGFDMPALKAVAENLDDKLYVEKILSSIFTAKLFLFIVSFFIAIILLHSIPLLKENIYVFLICYFQVFSFVFFQQWYFQGIQRMKIITYLQLFLKILSLPFIFIFVTKPSDISTYGLIVTSTSVIFGIISLLIILHQYKLKIRLVSIGELKIWFKEALPFFFSNSSSALKDQIIILFIGTYFGMKELAIYDLANKIVLLPKLVFLNINNAIFPKLIKNIDRRKVKKIFRYETLVSLFVILLIVLFGPLIIEILGGEKMQSAYLLAIFISITIMSWLLVGAYISFVFVPNNKTSLVSKNQLIALVSFVLYTVILLMISKSIIAFSIAIALSGITEIFYCKYVTSKYKLL